MIEKKNKNNKNWKKSFESRLKNSKKKMKKKIGQTVFTDRSLF